MTNTTTKPPRVIMLLASMPPAPVGGAEKQAVRLCKALSGTGVTTIPISWGKIWNTREGQYEGIRFIRLRSVLDILIDIPSLLKPKRKKQATVTKIEYDDSVEATNKITGKVWFGMRMRYQLFYINCLLYLWIRRNEFDIIHVHMMEWPAFVAVRIGKLLNKKVVIKDSTMNGIINILRYPDGKKKQAEITGYAYCVAMTTTIKENFLSAGIPLSRIAEIPNGIEITPLPVRNAIWNNKVIFVGNLTQQPAKGIDILLRAWILVLQAVPNATLQLVGSGDIASYEAYTSQLGISKSVQFLGKKDNVRELLLNADVFVLPSRREGMSNALMEAMVCGMPVVATEVSGSADLITHGVSGLLVPVARIKELAEAIITMLCNEQSSKQMGLAAYQSIKQKCDMSKVSKQYSELYNKILAGT